MALVEVDEQQLFMGLTAGTDDDLLDALIAETQALFENEIGRSGSPFGAAITGRTEIHQAGSGSTVLSLDYPIASITSIVAGRDVALPDETILAADTTIVVWQAGSRELYRVDGGYWQRWNPTWVKVVYTTLADEPLDVKLAIKEKVAERYYLKDKHGFSSITRGARSWTLGEGGGNAAATGSAWDAAIRNHRRGWFR
jgi:hypothetical protein